MDKQTLRRHFIARRQALPKQERARAESQVKHYLRTVLADLAHQSVVAAYVAHRGEIDPTMALKSLQNQGLCIALPVLYEHEEAEVLQFRLWRVGASAALVTGRHAIPVPHSGTMVTPDAVVVPLVAFHRTGARLGYGGGWYDRTLKLLRKANPAIPAIGLAFACQEADTLPADAWDEPLTAIVTERGVIVPSAMAQSQKESSKNNTLPVKKTFLSKDEENA